MNEFIYKKLDIQNYEQILLELKTWFIPQIPSDGHSDAFLKLDNQDFFDKCPITMDWFKENNLQIIAVVLTTFLPDNAQKDSDAPHIDTQSTDLAINFPILNCKNTFTSFYETINENKVLTKLGNGITYWTFDENTTYKEIDRFVLDGPVLFNTKIPHQVNNPTNFPRYSASFRFKEDPISLV